MNLADATIFNPSAEVYERHLVPAIFRPWAAELVELAAPRTGERVLDVCCGTGIVARTAAPLVGPGGTVVGCDVNPAMLAVARREAEALQPPIAWEEGDAVSMPFGDASFDAVLCQQGVQFFGDRLEGLREMRRVTTPRGRVALGVWLGLEHHGVYRAFDEVLAGHLGGGVVEGSDAPFSLPPGELRDLLRAAGFAHARVRTSIGPVRFASVEGMLDAVGGAHAPVAEAVAALDAGARARLLVDLSAALLPYTDDAGVVYPMLSSVVLARP